MTLSIIIPVYNSDKYIEKCINSILNQTYENFEIIIINDGSTDNSLNIIKSFNDPRIKIFKQKNNGVSEARNTGILKATGDYIMFIDSDDYIEKNMLEKFIKIKEKYNPDIIICGFYSETNNGIPDKFYYEEKYYKDINMFKNDLVELYNNDLLYNVWNKFYKKNIITSNKIKFPKTIFGEDNIFNQLYLKKCKSYYNTKECLYHYVREQKNSTTMKYIPNLFDIRIKENKDFINFFKYYNINYDLYINFLSKRFIERTIGCLENIHRKNNLTLKEKIKKTDIIIHNPETKKYLKIYNTNNKKIRLILKSYNLKNPFYAYTLGFFLHSIKKILPETFNKTKNKR